MLESLIEKYGSSYKFKLAARALALIAIAALTIAAYVCESADGNMVELKFKDGYNIIVSKTTGDGFHFRVENLSQTDIGSIKMTINKEFSYTPRMIIYRDGFADFETSSFKNSSGEKLRIGPGQQASILFECVTALGKQLIKTATVKYEK